MFGNTTPISSTNVPQDEPRGKVRERATEEEEEDENESPQKKQKKSTTKGKPKAGPSGRFVVKK